MRIKTWATLALAAALPLAGCKGFFDLPTTAGGGGGGGTTTTTATSGNIYLVNAATNQLVGFYVNAGKLAALSGSPYTLPTSPIAITVAPNNNFLYVGTIGGIYLYTIASDGALTLGNSGSPISPDQALSLQVSANDNWLVDVASGVGSVHAVPINSTTGEITSSTEQLAALPVTTVQQVAIAADDSYVFVAMGTGGMATIPFNVGNANPFGDVTTIAAKGNGGSALSVAVDPDERLFYVGETLAVSGSNTGGVRVFNFGTVTEVSGSPYASGGLAPYSILPRSTGDFVYAVNRQTSSGSTGVITGYSIAASGSSYALTALSSTFAAGTNPMALVEDNSGQFVFAVNFGGDPDLSGYTFDATTAGALDSVISATTGTDPTQATAIAAAH
ncbi:MAG TPA: beta-propeller fold lactonase family protein [Terracidiphilus sp.]|nr:beta-propeller fold lactonase family protein [Terracidiphilus sp.]